MNASARKEDVFNSTQCGRSANDDSTPWPERDAMLRYIASLEHEQTLLHRQLEKDAAQHQTLVQEHSILLTQVDRLQRDVVQLNHNLTEVQARNEYLERAVEDLQGTLSRVQAEGMTLRSKLLDFEKEDYSAFYMRRLNTHSKRKACVPSGPCEGQDLAPITPTTTTRTLPSLLVPGGVPRLSSPTALGNALPDSRARLPPLRAGEDCVVVPSPTVRLPCMGDSPRTTHDAPLRNVETGSSGASSCNTTCEDIVGTHFVTTAHTTTHDAHGLFPTNRRRRGIAEIKGERTCCESSGQDAGVESEARQYYVRYAGRSTCVWEDAHIVQGISPSLVQAWVAAKEGMNTSCVSI